MRIISGKAGGRKLFTPPGKTQEIRPTSDRAREALFNIIGNSIEGTRVLDLFAGTGALGLEAYSRGASEVILVDFHKQSLNLIRRNITICANNDKECSVSLIRHDLRKGLPPTLLDSPTNQFDYIFLDPPYSKGLCLRTLENLNKANIFSSNCTVVAEDRSSETLPEQCGSLLLTDHRTYGDTGFWLYSPEQTIQPHNEEKS